MEGYLYATLKTEAIAAVQDMQAGVSDPADPSMYEEEVPAKRPNLSLPTQLRSGEKTQPMYAILCPHSPDRHYFSLSSYHVYSSCPQLGRWT